MPKHCYMLIGIPGSGKTTYRNDFLAMMGDRENIWVISSDDYIEAIGRDHGKTYSEVFADKTLVKDAMRMTETDFRHALIEEATIIFDRTNLTRASRKKYLDLLKENGYDVVGVVFSVPIDLNERLASRPGKTIPPHVIDSMIENFEMPVLMEGFKSIFFHNTPLFQKVKE